MALRHAAATTKRLAALAVVALAVAAAAACGASDGEPRGAAAGETAAASDQPQRRAAIVCDGETTRATARRARVQADGIHLRIENTSGWTLGWSAEVPGAGGLGDSAQPGTSNHVLDLPPGTLRLACFDRRKDDPSEVPRVAVDGVDPDGVWKAALISADCNSFTVYATFAGGARGGRGTPVSVVRDYLEKRGSLRGQDRLERAGYPDGPWTHVSLVRDGEVVAVFHLESDGGGGWLVARADACSGEGFD